MFEHHDKQFQEVLSALCIEVSRDASFWVDNEHRATRECYICHDSKPFLIGYLSSMGLALMLENYHLFPEERHGVQCWDCTLKLLNSRGWELVLKKDHGDNIEIHITKKDE